jgi:hypothetical protein
MWRYDQPMHFYHFTHNLNSIDMTKVQTPSLDKSTDSKHCCQERWVKKWKVIVVHCFFNFKTLIDYWHKQEQCQRCPSFYEFKNQLEWKEWTWRIIEDSLPEIHQTATLVKLTLETILAGKWPFMIFLQASLEFTYNFVPKWKFKLQRKMMLWTL